MGWYESISYLMARFVPTDIVDRVAYMLKYAGMHMDPRIWIGSTFLFSLLVGAIVFLIAWLLARIIDFVFLFELGFSAILLTLVVFYLLLYFRIEDRRKRAEKYLPDALQMIAANIRAGMTPVVALRHSARPEFGPLEEEIKVATTRALGTESFTEAFMDIGERIRSEVLLRIISLFTTSMRAGGNLPSLLENTADEILEAQQLKRELIAGTNMYIMFILFTIVLGMPLLLSISIQFVGMVEELHGSGGTNMFSGELGISFAPPVSAAFIEQISIVTLVITAMFASMLMGVIHEGSELYGLRYFPLYSILALIAFYVIKLYVLPVLVTPI